MDETFIQSQESANELSWRSARTAEPDEAHGASRARTERQREFRVHDEQRGRRHEYECVEGNGNISRRGEYGFYDHSLARARAAHDSRAGHEQRWVALSGFGCLEQDYDHIALYNRNCRV